MKPREASGKGFTLLELLAVVAIMAVLIALVFPVYSSIRRKLDKSACATNLRNWGIALNLYVSENAGQFPEKMVSGQNNTRWNYRLANASILSFSEQTELVCPALRSSDSMFAGHTESYWVSIGYVNSVGYAYNSRLSARPVVSVGIPSATMLLIETHLGHSEVTPTTAASAYAWRHDESLNVLFADGHVEPKKQSDGIPSFREQFWAPMP